MRKCPSCGGILQKGRFGLICPKCNKEYYFSNERENLLRENAPARSVPQNLIKCPMCSWDLIRNPNNPKLFVCSNGRCPTRDEKDTPYPLDELKNLATLYKRVGSQIKDSVQAHIDEGGEPPSTWDETKNIAIRRNPSLVFLLVPPDPVKMSKKEEESIASYVDGLLKKGWPEKDIVEHVLKKMNERKKGRLEETERSE